MATHVYHTFDAAQVRKILSDPRGGVARDLVRRGIRVASQAKRELASSPKRIDTGRLRTSITQQLGSYNRMPLVRVGTNVKYARFVHDGTGLYGPRHAVIKPKQAKVLRWTKRDGTVRYAKFIRGMAPNPFLKKALKAARG